MALETTHTYTLCKQKASGKSVPLLRDHARKPPVIRLALGGLGDLGL